VITQAYSPEDVAQFHALVDDAQQRMYALRGRFRCGAPVEECEAERAEIVTLLAIELTALVNRDGSPTYAIAELLVSAAGAL
jgi:hypothetical protein